MTAPGKILYYNDIQREVVPIKIKIKPPQYGKAQIHFDSSKVAIWADQNMSTPLSNGQYYSFGESTTEQEYTIYVAAISYSNDNQSEISCDLYDIGDKKMCSDSVIVTNTIFEMDHETTNFNPGYKNYTTEQKNEMWTCDLKQGIYITADSGGKKDTRSHPHVDINGAGPFLVTHQCFPNGFVMRFKYDFIRRGVPGDYGYVQALNKPETGEHSKRISFVSNSGIKIGGQQGFEIAILDTNGMVGFSGGLNAFKYGKDDKNKDIGINNVGQVRIIKNNTPYDSEPLSKLMNGIGYNDLGNNTYDYREAGPDAVIDPNLKGDWEKYFNTLIYNMNNCKETGNTMIIDCSPNGTISVTFNGITQYYETQKSFVLNLPIYIQSHWGSGVKFYDIQITSK